jgi:C1A family cysteine protease
MELYYRMLSLLKIGLFIIPVFSGHLILAPLTFAQPTLAPLNPAFLQYIHDLQAPAISGSTPDSCALGHMPSPIDFSHLTEFPASSIKIFRNQESLSMPSWYDLRALGRVTPVKNQLPCGVCAIFAAYASLESNLLPSETRDFSENHLKNTHGFDIGFCEGISFLTVTAYLARWSGPVDEKDDLFNPYSTVSPIDLPVQKHIQNVLVLPDRTGPLDNDNIKEAILNYGAIATAMDFRNRSPYYNPKDYAYYFNGLAETGHAVAIVGWDDNFPKGKFYITPPGDGAFIVKNSYGEDFGEKGYFYVSYYDTTFGTDNYVFNGAEPTTNYSHIYQYDPLGWTWQCGAGSGNTAWFANVFTAIANQSLKAVSFYTVTFDADYEIYIYLNAASGPLSGAWTGSKTGTIPLAGYHTVLLDSPIALTTGQVFSVVVRLTTPGYNWPIPIEYPRPGYSTAARADAGQSYISPDGIDWWDITTIYPNTNVCLKAFTGNVFSDIPPGYWAEDFINTVYYAGITSGYGDGRFGSEDFVTREQMAVFITRALNQAPADGYCGSIAPFLDVAADRWSCKYIKRLVELGITAGIGQGLFGPEGAVTREQMAAFITRALDEVPSDGYCGTEDPFTDVPYTWWSCKYVKRLRELGITAGIGGGLYGPGNPVTRAQMAVFLARAFLGM